MDSHLNLQLLILPKQLSLILIQYLDRMVRREVVTTAVIVVVVKERNENQMVELEVGQI